MHEGSAMGESSIVTEREREGQMERESQRVHNGSLPPPNDSEAYATPPTPWGFGGCCERFVKAFSAFLGDWCLFAHGGETV